MTPFVHGNRHTTLQHILQKPHRLQTNRLTPGIRTRNQQNALFTGQLDIKRNHFLSVLGQRNLQERMNSIKPVNHLPFFQRRLSASRFHSPQSLGTNKINFGQELIRLKQSRYMRTYNRREIRQDTDNFPAFLTLQLADAVVGFHHFCRFNEHGLSGGRLIMNDSPDLSFHTGGHRNHQSSVAHGRCHILLHIPFRLSRTKNRIQTSGDTSCRSSQFTAYAKQFWRSIILHLAKLVQYIIDTRNQHRENHHFACQFIKSRIRRMRLLVLLIIRLTEKAYHVTYCFQRTAQVKQFRLIHVKPFHTNPLQGRTHVKKILAGKIVLSLQDTDKLHNLLEPSVYFAVIIRKRHFIYSFHTQRTETFAFHQLPDLVEPYFLFKVLRIYHVFS